MEFRLDSGSPMVDPGVVYIGKKPTMNYVLAVVTHFNGGSREVVVKGRGLSVSRLDVVADIVRGRFFPDAAGHHVRKATEKLTAEGGQPVDAGSTVFDVRGVGGVA